MKPTIMRFEIKGEWHVDNCTALKNALSAIRTAMDYIGDGPGIEVVVYCKPKPIKREKK